MSMPSTEQTSSYILPLDSADATVENTGGKGASLSRLARAGLPVPPGFDITTDAYRRFVEQNKLQDALLAALKDAQPDNPASLEQASSRIIDLFMQGTIPDDVAQQIRDAYAHLGNGDTVVAVRSSATAEDLPDMSFAGQQETYLNIQGAEAILDAVKRCWASLWTARAIGYRARNGIDPQQVSLAVVVQELVPADAAGILFTANPVSGARDQVMINAAWGLGEAIVGGNVTPDTIVATKANGAIARQEIADKAVMTTRVQGGTREEEVPEERRRQPVLTAAQVAELARTGTQIEQLYDKPVDIEWALRNGQFYIVQARPITTLDKTGAAAPEVEIDWNLPPNSGQFYRASVVELLPAPVSPLFATLGFSAWNAAYERLFGAFWTPALISAFHLVTINDYAYYTFKPTRLQGARLLLSVPGLMVGLAQIFKNAAKRWEQKARPGYAKVVQDVEAHNLSKVSARRLMVMAQTLVAAAARHYVIIQSGILPAAYNTETFFAQFYDRVVRRPGDPPALTFLLGYDSTPMLADKSLYDLAMWARTKPQLLEYLQTTPGTPIAAGLQQDTPVEAAGPAWSEFKQRFADHLRQYGHMIYDLDFAQPVPAGDPAPLLETLKYYLSGTAPNPHDRQAKAVLAGEQATRMIEARLKGPRLAIFKQLLRGAQRFAPLRENALADVGLGWPAIRRIFHELGTRLVKAGAMASPDDIYMLRMNELESAVANLDAGKPVENMQARIDERRRTIERESKVTPPVALPEKEGFKFAGIDFSGVSPAQVRRETGDTIKGQGTSPGTITGTARVIHGPDEFNQMQPGDILVAKITTPAWTPLFALASGVVTDVGGALSHGSIVAREYHIPAVLGTGFATERIQSGQRITVDGDNGTVTLHAA